MELFDLAKWQRFHTQHPSCTACLIDQVTLDSRRIASTRSLFVALSGQESDGHHFIYSAVEKGVKVVIVHETWQDKQLESKALFIKVSDTLAAFQELVFLYRRNFHPQMVSVTGSVGKTMVKDLLAYLLKGSFQTCASPESFNSQIGVPLTLLHLKQSDKVAVVESAVSQKREMDTLAHLILPTAVVLTPIGRTHLETLGGWEGAAFEYTKLLRVVPETGWALFPNEERLKPFLQGIACRLYPWNTPQEDLPHAEYLNPNPAPHMLYKVAFPCGKSFEGTISTGFSFFLNLINMAVKAAFLLGVATPTIIQRLQEYRVDLMRRETWRSPLGTTFINEPYGADPQSVDKALRHFKASHPKSRKTFLFGGLKKEEEDLHQDYRLVGESIQSHGIDHLALYGQHDFSPILDVLQSKKSQTEIEIFPSFQEAILTLKPHLKKEDAVLVKGDNKEPAESVAGLFHDSSFHNQCIVNLNAIERNIHTIRSHLPHFTRIMVMTKAQGYGTDDLELARFLNHSGVPILGVSYVDEGVNLKRACVTQSVFVLNATVDEVPNVISYGLEVGVSSQEIILALNREAKVRGTTVGVHLHVDTGMSRFGCRPDSVVELAVLIQQSSHLRFEGFMTHLACAEDPAQDAFTEEQIRQFRVLLADIRKRQIFPRWIHASNSAGLSRFSIPECNMVRIGLALFGLHASPATKDAIKLEPALSLVSRIVGLNLCHQGETIGYGRSYVVQKKEAKIAVLPIGYFDGLHRHYSGKGEVMIRGQKAPMVGKICMDYMMIDVSDIPDVKIGDPALLFGKDEHGFFTAPEELAAKGESIAHELITCLGPRIQRIFVYE